MSTLQHFSWDAALSLMRRKIFAIWAILLLGDELKIWKLSSNSVLSSTSPLKAADPPIIKIKSLWDELEVSIFWTTFSPHFWKLGYKSIWNLCTTCSAHDSASHTCNVLYGPAWVPPQSTGVESSQFRIFICRTYSCTYCRQVAISSTAMCLNCFLGLKNSRLRGRNAEAR